MTKTKGAQEALIGTHDGVEIFLDADGVFYCQLEAGGRVTTSTTLKALKTRITDHHRNQARLAAASVPCVVLGHYGYWDRDEIDRLVTLEGTFQGLNAHTGDFKLKLTRGVRGKVNYQAGQVVELRDSGWRFFRPDDTAGRELVRLRQEELVAARKALKAAEKALDLAEREHSFELSEHHHYVHGRSKAETAQDAEAALVTFLTTPPKSGG